ncbi:MAG: HAD family phosphatase [Oscillospiraceae bacterium]
MKISGAIFDMDGTLTDSMFIWEDLCSRYLISCGINPHANLREEIKKLTMGETIEYIRTVYSLKQTNEEIYKALEAMLIPMYRDEVLPKENVFLLLDRLKERGVKMAVASATDEHIVRMVLEKNGLMKYFSEVFTCTGVGAGKEEPLIYEKALEFLGTPKNETVIFEDAIYAIKTAWKANFPVAAVYDDSQKAYQDEIKELSDFYITDYREAAILF